MGDRVNDLFIRTCSREDIELLAALNKQLIEDEQHDNPMNVEQLKDRMNGFLAAEYKAYFFVEDHEVKGYALVNHEKKPLYLRQFFICRPYRRMGYGKQAFRKLIECLDTDQMDIEVMHWNERGYEFWKSLGFKERSIYMRLS